MKHESRWKLLHWKDNYQVTYDYKDEANETRWICFELKLQSVWWGNLKSRYVPFFLVYLWRCSSEIKVRLRTPAAPSRHKRAATPFKPKQQHQSRSCPQPSSSSGSHELLPAVPWCTAQQRRRNLQQLRKLNSCWDPLTADDDDDLLLQFNQPDVASSSQSCRCCRTSQLISSLLLSPVLIQRSAPPHRFIQIFIITISGDLNDQRPGLFSLISVCQQLIVWPHRLQVLLQN